jgi:hypothetical protein
MFGSVAAAQQRYVVDEAGQPHSQRKSQHQGLTKMQPSNAKNCAPRSYVYVRGHGRRSCSVIVQRWTAQQQPHCAGSRPRPASPTRGATRVGPSVGHGEKGERSRRMPDAVYLAICAVG